MATAYVTMGTPVARDVFDGASLRSVTVTTSGVTAASSITAGEGEYAKVFCATAVYARAGATVTLTNGEYCPPGVATWFRCVTGQAVALIDV